MTPDELRQTIRDLPPLPNSAPPFTWLGHRIELRRHILNGDPANFRKWGVIHATMNTDPGYQDYHLDRWEHTTGLSVAGLDSIVEFGGGYGAMALMLYERGFQGKYYSYDFPEFVALQRYYTSLDILTDIPPACDLLIAICSLSEADLATRGRFLSGLTFDHCLIRYQYEWGVNNHAYFQSIEGERWCDQEDTNHWYLVR